jgi:hypothetical protein
VSDRPCKRCRAPLYFATSPTNRTLPLQAVRNVYVIELDDHGVAQAKPLERGRYYVSHYETCPYASEFTKPPRVWKEEP